MNFWIQFITALVFLIIIVGLYVLYEIPSVKKSENKWIVKSSHGLLGFITNYPFAMVAICYTLICLLIVFVEMFIGGIVLDGSTILVCISIIGFVGTIIGLIITYLQLKRNNDQFFGYYDFYRIADELLDEKSNRKIRFHFSTPIPGHIAYGVDKDFDLFLTKLLQYKGEIEIIIPNESEIKAMYNEYVDREFRGETYSKEIIYNLLSHLEGAKEDKRLDVARFVMKLREKPNVSVYCYQTKVNPEAITNLYISDGKVAVYAIPLHFYNIQDENRNSENRKEPTKTVLVGFVTSDRALVTTLDDNFETIMKNSKILNEGDYFLKYEELDN